MATISDVARLAGVSHQTVSRVLNAAETVRPATRARVEQAIQELRYRPSAVARALASRKTRTIGLVATGAPLYGPSSTTSAFNEAARKAGYQVTIASLASPDRSALVDAIEVLLGQDVEALVIIVADYSTFEALEGITTAVPLLAAESSGRPGYLSVSIDQFEGARLAVRHLLDLGHRDILHLAGPPGSVDAAERERGWRSELTAASLPVRQPLVGAWTPGSGYERGKALVRSGALGRGAATAVFCANDQMAVGLLHALREAGIEVPEHVSIVGFDDIPESAHLLPSLTTVRQDFEALGARMMEVLLSGLLGDGPVGPTHTTPTLVIRDSTAAMSRPRDPA